MKPRALPRSVGLLILQFLLVGSSWAATPLTDELLAPSVQRPGPRSRPEIEVQPAIFTSRPTLYASRASDGTVATVERGDDGDELWLYPAPAAKLEPRLLLASAARLSWPALSRDGRYLAWIDTRDDVKGDLWILDLTRNPARPQRLSDSRSEEAAPAFTSDGRGVIVHQLLPGVEMRRLMRYALDASPPTPLALSIDAAFAQPAADGRSWVFVSRHSDPGGDLWLLDAKGGVRQLTFGPERDLYPSWEGENSLVFSRLSAPQDSEGSGAQAELVRLRLDRLDTVGRPRTFPLTVPALAVLGPQSGAGQLFFVAAQPGGTQFLTLPATGEIPVQPTLAEQWQLAERLFARRPFDAPHARLASIQVLAREEAPSREGALSTLRLIELAEADQQLPAALALASEASRRYAAFADEATRATLAGLRIDAQLRCRAASGMAPRKVIIASAVAAMLQLSADRNDDLVGHALIAAGRLLNEEGDNAGDRLAALERFERAAGLSDVSRPLRAEAAGRHALLLAQMTGGEAGETALIAVARDFDDQEIWAERAVSALLDRRTPPGGDPAEQTRQLAALAEAYRVKLPRLAMGAWNRSGDLAFAAEEWSRARDAWRTVLDSFPPLLTPTAAARFALAELLYREERYVEATALYETEMGEAPEDAPIYQLARAAYIRKRLAAGESLYRLGEVASARVAFLDLIRYEGRSLPAHRGYIKSVAAQGQAEALLALYRKLLDEHPDDPVLLYGAGLCETYMPGEERLRSAGKTLKRAYERLPGSPYPAQTLGYVAEVLETVHGEVGGLERALALYRRAALLNRHDVDPDNVANLDLNIGNVAFLLGRNATAHQHYARRFAAGVPFDHPETELLFYRRAGAVAFQVGATDEAIARYSEALRLVDLRLDPSRPLDAFGRLARRVNERLFSGEEQESPALHQALNEQQVIAAELDRLGATVPAAPPEPGWDAFAGALRSLLGREETLISGAHAWSKAARTHQVELRTLRQRVNDELAAVPRLVETRAELHDRLGLASLEAERFAEARAHFDLAYALNQALGRRENLLLNRRSASLAAFRQGETATGNERLQLLTAARRGFGEVLRLVESAPPPPKSPPRRGSALISVDLAVALDQGGATQSAFGFTPAQERRLAETYIARIDAELGEPTAAATSLRRQLEHYPTEVEKIAPGDRFGVGLLSHRVAHLDHALGDDKAAAAAFRRALLTNLAEGNVRGATINLVNWGRLLDPAMPGSSSDFQQLQAQVAALLAQQREALPDWSAARFALDSGGLYLRFAETDPDPVAHQALLLQAVAAWNRTLALTANQRSAGERERLRLRAAALLNRATVFAALGLDAAATTDFTVAAETAKSGRLTGLLWRAEAGLGHYPEALALLAQVPPSEFDLQAGELFARFAPHLEALVAGDRRAALNRVEELSEIERVQRLAPAFFALNDPAVAARLAQAAPHLRELRGIDARLAAAPEVERDYLRLRRQQEEALLVPILGAKGEYLPPLYAGLDRTLRDYLAASVALSAQLDAAELPSAPAWLPAVSEVQTLRSAGVAACSGKVSDLACPQLLAQPAALAELDLALEGRVVLRPVPLGNDHWLLFTLDANGDLQFESFSTAELQSRISATAGEILASEVPERFRDGRFLTRSLSLTHLFRAVSAREPFRRQVLDPAGWWPVGPPFVKVEGTDLATTLPLAHTLILPGAAGLLTAPPSGDDGVATAHFVFTTVDARRQPLDLRPAVSLALVVAPQAGLDQAYALGHFLSLQGIPSLLIADPGTSGSTELAKTYATASLSDAVPRLPAGWLLLGDWGLDAGAANRLGRSRFSELTRQGVTAQQQGEALKALALFEDALALAGEDAKLAAQLIPLHRAARESAFAAGLLDRAILHAAALVELLARQAPYTVEHADALLRYGLLCGRAERFAEAEPALKESVATFSDLGLIKEQAAALGGFGQVMENALNYDSAGILFTEAAGLRQLLKDDLSLADQYRNLGRLYDLRLSRYAEAEQYYARAVDLYAAKGSARLRAEALLERGRTRRLLGDFEAAESFYREALAGIDVKELRTRARITLELANNAWFQGRYQEAFEKRDEVEKAAQQAGWNAEVVMAKNTGGLIWSTLGDQKRALVELRGALTLAEGEGGRQDEIATTLNNIGLVQRESGDLQGALATLDRALAIDRKIGSRWAMAYDLRNIGQCYLRQANPARALASLTEAEALATAIGDQVSLAKILLARADAEQQLKRTAEARNSYDKALAIADRLFLPEVRWRALYGQAQLWQLGAEHDKAITAYRLAIATIEELRATIRLDQLKDGFLSDKGDVYAGLVGLLAGLGRSDEAFDVAERSRARNLIDILGRQRLSLSGTGNQELYDRQLRLKESLREQERFLALAKTEAERAMYTTALDQLRADYQDLLLEIEKQRPELLSLVKVDPLTLAQLRPLLEPGIVLLSYYQLPDRLLCWRIDRQGTTLYTLKISAAELAGTIATYRRMLQNLEPLEKVSTELYTRLLAEPLAGAGPIRSLGIIPHGSLHYLSFATLSDGRDYLVERHPLFYLPSASVLRYTLERRPREKNHKVLAIGNPDLGAAALDLPFAEREAGMLRWSHPDLTLLTRERATESWVRTHINEFGIIHLASHGEFDPVNPLFSSVRLTRDPAADGRLEAEEIFGLDIKADLVVLSACQTGLGDLRKGDDVVGMNRAFLFAGTHALLSSLWRVSDVATAIEMKQFYRSYGRMNKAEALRKAMLHVKTRYPHPGYWGAFVLTGDYE